MPPRPLRWKSMERACPQRRDSLWFWTRTRLSNGASVYWAAEWNLIQITPLSYVLYICWLVRCWYDYTSSVIISYYHTRRWRAIRCWICATLRPASVDALKRTVAICCAQPSGDSKRSTLTVKWTREVASSASVWLWPPTHLQTAITKRFNRVRSFELSDWSRSYWTAVFMRNKPAFIQSKLKRTVLKFFLSKKKKKSLFIFYWTI